MWTHKTHFQRAGPVAKCFDADPIAWHTPLTHESTRRYSRSETMLPHGLRRSTCPWPTPMLRTFLGRKSGRRFIKTSSSSSCPAHRSVSPLLARGAPATRTGETAYRPPVIMAAYIKTNIFHLLFVLLESTGQAKLKLSTESDDGFGGVRPPWRSAMPGFQAKCDPVMIKARVTATCRVLALSPCMGVLP